MKKIFTTILVFFTGMLAFAQTEVQRVDKLKAEAALEVEKLAVLGQQINDMLFS